MRLAVPSVTPTFAFTNVEPKTFASATADNIKTKGKLTYNHCGLISVKNVCLR